MSAPSGCLAPGSVPIDEAILVSGCGGPHRVNSPFRTAGRTAVRGLLNPSGCESRALADGRLRMSPTETPLRLGELVATFALAQDNAFGQPLESQLRSCLLADWMCRE